MSFIGETTARNINTSAGKIFRVFVTEQFGGLWVATILYADNGKISTHNETADSRVEVYGQALRWTLNNIDSKAIFDPL